MLHPFGFVWKEPTAEKAMPLEGMNAWKEVTHHSGDPRWAWLAWRPLWSLGRGESRPGKGFNKKPRLEEV